MTAFGERGQCPECGRIIGLLPGEQGSILRYHRDIEGDGMVCQGSGLLPFVTEDCSDSHTGAGEL